MRTRKIFSFFVFNLLLICLTTVMTMAQGNSNGHGKGNGNTNKPKNQIISLKPGTAEPMATGIAKIFFKTNGNAMQRFQVVGANLTNGKAYTLVVDGNMIATLTAGAEKDDDEDDDATDDGSAVEFMFSKKAKGGGAKNNNLPTALDPVTNIKHIELRDAANAVILSGDFPQP